MASTPATATPTPVKIEPLNSNEILFGFSNSEEYSVPYLELRFLCPCASCVDEHTGKRMIKRERIPAGIHAVGVQPIGRYAIQFNWSDRHSTGMYHYDKLLEISQKLGTRVK